MTGPMISVGTPNVASLAVDVEPTVFWDAVTPSPTALLEQWKRGRRNFRSGLQTECAIQPHEPGTRERWR